MTSFVIEYNRSTRAVVWTEFAGPNGNRAAIQRRLDVEMDHRNDDVEVVSLVSDSIETVRKTHSRYFRDELIGA